jgi:hypothetical protein
MYETVSTVGELRKKQSLKIIDDCEPKNIYNAGLVTLLHVSQNFWNNLGKFSFPFQEQNSIWKDYLVFGITSMSVMY